MSILSLEQQFVNATFRIAFIFFVSTLFVSCDKSIKDDNPQKIGKKVLSILKELNVLSKGDFKSYFLSYEEFKGLEGLVNDEKARRFINTFSKEDYLKDLDDMHNQLKDDGGQYGIIWKKITFLDFVWNLESEAGVQICKGNLYFLSHGNSYSVSVECVLVKEKYTLTRVNYLTEYARVEDNVKTE